MIARTTATPKAAMTATKSATSGFKSFLKHAEKADQILCEESGDDIGLLPEVEHVMSAAKRFGGEFDGEKVRQRQQVMRNIVSVLASRARSNEPSAKGLADELLTDAFTATESLGVRAGYMLGVARGMKWAIEQSLSDEKDQKKKKGAK